MNKVKELNFDGKTIYCGLDIHKSNWKVNFGMDDKEIGCFSQDPDPELLSKHFKRNYPGAKVKVVYEAGFSGFGAQRALTELGIECIVVNAADVPSSDKERKRKDDKRDARKLRRELADGSLKGIYIPDIAMEHARTLLRQRHRLVLDQTRCVNRIRHMIMSSGMPLGIQQQKWSQRFVKQLQELECGTPELRKSLDLAIEEYKQIRIIIKDATLTIRRLSKQPPFAQIQPYLRSIDGLGLINAMVVQTEIQDIYRFKILDSLCDYAGLVPNMNSSGDRTVIKGITRRCNEFLREALIESSWILKHKDPAMRMKFNEYEKRMNSNKAIIRIGKHLLSRITYVWKNQIEYQRCIVG